MRTVSTRPRIGAQKLMPFKDPTVAGEAPARICLTTAAADVAEKRLQRSWMGLRSGCYTYACRVILVGASKRLRRRAAEIAADEQG